MRVAAEMNAFACAVVSFLPDCACTSVMTAWSVLHASAVLPFCSPFNAVCTLAARLDPGPAPVLTTVSRSETCCTAPWTVTVKLSVSVLPPGSITEQCTVVVPTGKRLPDAGVQSGVRVSSGSKADTLYGTDAPPGPVASTTMSPGKLSTGGVVSRETEARMPCPSGQWHMA